METVKQLTDANEIAGHVYRMLMAKLETPTFPIGSVDTSIVAKVMGKSTDWVRAGIDAGWLPIGYSTLSSGGGRRNYYISPKLLWEVTGFVWQGETNPKEINK